MDHTRIKNKTGDGVRQGVRQGTVGCLKTGDGKTGDGGLSDNKTGDGIRQGTVGCLIIRQGTVGCLDKQTSK